MITPILNDSLARLRNRVPSLRAGMLGREQGQAFVRVVIILVLAIYFRIGLGPITDWPFHFAAFYLASIAYSIAILAHTLRAAAPNFLRRLVNKAIDITVITYLMVETGDAGVPLFALYLWVTIGNGFRFGVPALMVSAVMSVIGFGVVISTTIEPWQTHTALTIAVLLTLIILPISTIPLINHLPLHMLVSKFIARFRRRPQRAGSILSREHDGGLEPKLGSKLWHHLAQLRQRVIPLRGGMLGREQGQAVFRVAFVATLTIYLVFHPSLIAAWPYHLWVFYVSVIIYSAATLVHTLRAKAFSPVRQFLNNVTDVTGISYLIIQTGEAGVFLFAMYIWVTIGNGFRFGVPALVVSAILSVIGFSVVVSVSELWQQHLGFVGGVLFTLIVVPLYAAHLIQMLNATLKRAEEASAAKSRFLARMSHEMRTPLNGILGAAELLQSGRQEQIPPEERSLLQVIRDSVQVSLRQVTNVLDFSKIEAGKLVLEHANFDLHEIVNSTVDMLRPLAAQKGLRFLVRIAPETPFRLVGDRHHLRDILINLLANAVKFTERGQVTLEVGGHEDAARATVRFEIRDTGIGIAPGALNRIFESFAQEDTNTAQRYGGTGLGTTIAKQLVELMGGRIGVESVKGQGSVFRCDIPFDVQATAAAPDETLPEIRALLVSEDEALARHYERLFEALEGRLVHARTGHEAEEVLARAVRLGNHVHALLVDAAHAITDDGGHRYDELCGKAASIRVPAILVSDIAPPAERLREWGYHAVLGPRAEKGLVFAALHASPVRTVLADRGVVSVAPWVWGRRAGARRRLLVADDNRTNLMIVRRMLEQAGYEVEAVETSEEALERLYAGGYRLAVLDMHMPGMDGVTLLRQYRAMRPRSRLPVIMLTANVSLEAQRECAEAGADAYLAKPATAAELLSLVERLLREAEVEVLAGRAIPRADATGRTEMEIQDIIDVSVLAELDKLYHDPRELKRTLAEYEREGRDLLDRIAQACAARSHAAFCDRLHALKGNAANVGAVRLMQACQQAEAAGVVEFLRDRNRLLAEVRHAFADTLTALREYTQPPPQGGPYEETDKPLADPGKPSR